MKHLVLILAAIALLACGSNEKVETPEVPVRVSDLEKEKIPTEDELLHEITQLHQTLIDASSEVNRENAVSLLDKSNVFLQRFEESEKRLEVLQYGESAARGTNNLAESTRLLELLLREYPVLEERPKYMSLLAHTYLELDNKEEAKKWYSNLVQEHPDSEWTPDAQGNLELLEMNMSDAELMDFLKEKNNL